MGRRRATHSEWLQYYERADRARARFGDPFERHIRRGRQRNTLFNICVTVVLLGVTVAVTVMTFSLLGDP